MSALNRQSHATNDEALWLSTNGGVVTGDITARYITATSGLELTDNSTPANTIFTVAAATNGVTGNPIIQTAPGATLRFGQFSQANANTTLTCSAPGGNLDSFVCGGQISATGIAGSRGMANFNAKYLSFYDATAPNNIEAMRIGSATTGTPGLTFSEIEVQPGSTLYFNQIGQAANSYITPAASGGVDIFRVGGALDFDLLNCKTGGAADSVGTATLVNGTVVVNTTASDVNSIILLTRYNVNASTALGELRVSNKGANNFTIVSADPANPAVTEAGDLSDVMWMIVGTF